MLTGGAGAASPPRPSWLEQLELGEEEVLEALAVVSTRWEVSLDSPSATTPTAASGTWCGGRYAEPVPLLATLRICLLYFAW
jgi:hypothetical protein